MRQSLFLILSSVKGNELESYDFMEKPQILSEK